MLQRWVGCDIDSVPKERLKIWHFGHPYRDLLVIFVNLNTLHLLTCWRPLAKTQPCADPSQEVLRLAGLPLIPDVQGPRRSPFQREAHHRPRLWGKNHTLYGGSAGRIPANMTLRAVTGVVGDRHHECTDAIRRGHRAHRHH